MSDHYHQPAFLDIYRKPSSAANVTEQPVSPSLTLVSETSGSGLDGSSRAGSFSLPRIEDSLAELDQLEDELEAVTAITNSKSKASSNHGRSEPTQQAPSDSRQDKARKRVTLAIPQGAATVRAKPSEKVKPALRRSTSLTLRSRPAEEQKVLVPLRNQASQPRLAAASRSSGSKPMVTSTKPLTVPNFELPGEAVARRLKEQREARRAQQQQDATTKPLVAPSRLKSARPLTKPSFELPGEAISRRKREEREARLKAQEEEERKRREFKARPVRQSAGAAPVNCAQKGKTPTIEVSSQDPSTQIPKLKRSSTNLANLSSGALSVGRAAGRRGRVSFMEPLDDESRGTSQSGRSTSGKRNSVSAEEVVTQRARGREILIQDNSFKLNREREKREREEAAKMARLQAAERSRAAGREWAEKKRRKEEALRRALSSGEDKNSLA